MTFRLFPRVNRTSYMPISLPGSETSLIPNITNATLLILQELTSENYM